MAGLVPVPETSADQLRVRGPGRALEDVLLSSKKSADDEVREVIIGDLCMWAGYQNIIRAARAAARRLREARL